MGASTSVAGKGHPQRGPTRFTWLGMVLRFRGGQSASIELVRAFAAPSLIVPGVRTHAGSRRLASIRETLSFGMQSEKTFFECFATERLGSRELHGVQTAGCSPAETRVAIMKFESGAWIPVRSFCFRDMKTGSRRSNLAQTDNTSPRRAVTVTVGSGMFNVNHVSTSCRANFQQLPLDGTRVVSKCALVVATPKWMQR